MRAKGGVAVLTAAGDEGTAQGRKGGHADFRDNPPLVALTLRERGESKG